MNPPYSTGLARKARLPDTPVAPTSGLNGSGRGFADPDGAYVGLAAGFATAATACPERLRVSDYQFAGSRIRLEVVGPRLAAVYERSLAHLRVDEGSGVPGLRIRVWHAAETGTVTPALASLDDPRSKGELTASADGNRLRLRRSHTLTAFDRPSGTVYGWIADLDLLGIYEMGRPFNSELLFWNKERGLQALHAGLVAHQGRGALITGPSGSGKSTTTLSCLLSGLDFLSDDYLAIRPDSEGHPTGHALFASAFVVADHLRTFPTLARIAVSARYADEEKSMVPLADLGNGPLADSARLSAIVLPRVTGRPTPRVRDASSAEALLRMAPSSMLMLQRAGVEDRVERQVELEALSRLVETVPAYWLELGGGVEQIPGLIRDILGSS